MQITIKSKENLKQITLDKIKSIFKESKCPNESLMNSIPEMVSFENNTIYLKCEPEDLNVFTYVCEVGEPNDKR